MKARVYFWRTRLTTYEDYIVLTGKSRKELREEAGQRMKRLGIPLKQAEIEFE